MLKRMLDSLLFRSMKWAESRRRHLIIRSLKSAGRNISIQMPVCFTSPGFIEIGNDVSFAAYVHIWGGGGVRIGDRVMIGTHTSISSLTHDHSKKDMYKTSIRKQVIIESDVWIGSNCVIMPGITVGKGAVVGAGSVVNKDVPEMSIVAGVPAKIIGQRTINE